VLRNPEVKKITQPGFCRACSRLEEKSGELKELAVSMRMTPLTGLFQRMRRVVYDVAHKLGKEIEIEVKGADVEADRNIVEQITGPLMHLVRNAVDHGIEDNAAERIRAGKPGKGHIGLEATAESGRIIISVSDDGRGMDKNRLYETARAKGLTGAKSIGDYTDEEIYRLITLPGFSTKNMVTEFSGRGVGMDVVAKSLSEIGGSLQINSRLGCGSELSMSIPTSFAVLNGVLIKAGESFFVIEAAAVKEYIGLAAGDVLSDADGKEYLDYRPEKIPLIRLRERFQLSGSQDKGKEGMAVVLEHGNRQAGILFDSLIQEQEVVAKPIPSYVKKVRGISGCTQLDDDNIALILDISGLLQDEERSS